MDITPELVAQASSFSDLTIRLGKYPHSRTTKLLKKLVDQSKIDYSHFSKNGHTPRKKIEKICPICHTKFQIKSGHRETQTTCSYSCSNTYFAKSRITYKSYRAICFSYHEKKCVVCGEDKIVEVHHLDGNAKNNSPENLIPLCPTHHQYWHSKYRSIVKEKIDEYRSKMVLTFRSKHV